jgi:hypothetical protein
LEESRPELHHSLDTQGLQLLTDDALRHLPAKILYQETYREIIGERESV